MPEQYKPGRCSEPDGPVAADGATQGGSESLASSQPLHTNGIDPEVLKAAIAHVRKAKESAEADPNECELVTRLES